MERINASDNPALYEVLALLCMYRGYIEFDYKPLPECQAKVNKNAPSRVAADQSTTSIAPPEKVRGFVEDAPRMTKKGDFILTMRNINRRNTGIEIDKETGEILGESYYADKSNAQSDGTKKFGFDDGEYLYRTYRIDVRGDGKGIQLATVQGVGKQEDGKMGKVRLFPNVAARADREHAFGILA